MLLLEGLRERMTVDNTAAAVVEEENATAEEDEEDEDEDEDTIGDNAGEQATEGEDSVSPDDLSLCCSI